ncbi:hypothetical protein NE237_024464 [Protea cynaroides]|uniref:Uncharacterized protein n=1 Tax=Protea cynaroides TaxID=273540 RepID=A0A9Q0JQN5_9MAGN|nr:hypothetical protein NE237_024464 [Protea cynaroides]
MSAGNFVPAVSGAGKIDGNKGYGRGTRLCLNSNPIVLWDRDVVLQHRVIPDAVRGNNEYVQGELQTSGQMVVGNMGLQSGIQDLDLTFSARSHGVPFTFLRNLVNKNNLNVRDLISSGSGLSPNTVLSGGIGFPQSGVVTSGSMFSLNRDGVGFQNNGMGGVAAAIVPHVHIPLAVSTVVNDGSVVVNNGSTVAGGGVLMVVDGSIVEIIGRSQRSLQPSRERPRLDLGKFLGFSSLENPISSYRNNPGEIHANEGNQRYRSKASRKRSRLLAQGKRKVGQASDRPMVSGDASAPPVTADQSVPNVNVPVHPNSSGTTTAAQPMNTRFFVAVLSGMPDLNELPDLVVEGGIT